LVQEAVGVRDEPMPTVQLDHSVGQLVLYPDLVHEDELARPGAVRQKRAAGTPVQSILPPETRALSLDQSELHRFSPLCGVMVADGF